MNRNDTIFDRENAIMFAGDDPDLLQEIIQIYVENAPIMLQELESAIQRNDFELITRTAHTLKGESRTVGAIRCSETAEKIEAGGRRKNPSRLKELLASLRHEMDAYHQEIDHAF